MATDFVGGELCTAVGDVPSAVETSGEFTSDETGNRPDSSKDFFFPDGIVCPHLVKGGGLRERESLGVGNRHRLNTDTENSGANHLSGHGLETDTSYSSRYISPSPSPLPEPAFEPYVICTKTRSETSCSNESQYSSSSSTGEHSASWARDRMDFQDAGDLREMSEESALGHDRYGGAEADTGRVTMLVSASHDSPQLLCKTKPVLPPPEEFLEDEGECPPLSPLFFPSINPPPPPRSSPPLIPTSPPAPRSPTPPPSSSSSSSQSELHTSLFVRRARALTFHSCKAGEDEGRFNADYLGMKDVDMYAKSINSVAKELAMNQRPKEVQVFVTSERVRLAPPNSPTLFRSFMVKDILLVRKCSKNKRIIGVMVWKRKVGVPSCHILRCQDDLVATALYNAVWQQTQKVDEVAFSKSDKSCGQVQRPFSVDVHSSSDSGGDAGQSPTTEFLHKFPAIYIGSMATPKTYSTDSIVEKVLMESKPSRAKFVTVALSLLEIRYVEDRKELAGNSRESEEIFLSHETSRIRSMGAYGADKRFAGYIIKEEGKPMLAHVIKCNSAALMVSFTSFLRQSCQLMAHQRGGAFYEELSTDESEDWDASVENNPGIVRRIRSLTNSISHLTSHSTTSPGGTSSPTFQSHMHPSSTPTTPTTKSRKSPDTKKKSVDHTQNVPGPSPHDFGDDEYARFPVTYIGSASQESALTQQSVVDAMGVFAAEGTASGRAAVVKNTVFLQLSTLGINLTDKTRKLFIHRNYPCKTIAGYCRHPEDAKVFAFATYRPGYPNILKVHVFRCGGEPVEQVLDAMEYWLKVGPIMS